MRELFSIKLVYTVKRTFLVSLLVFSKITRRNHNTQHSLLKMLELWKDALDKGMSVDDIFMDPKPKPLVP